MGSALHDDLQEAQRVHEFQWRQCAILVMFIILWVVTIGLGITAAASNSEWHSVYIHNEDSSNGPRGPDLRLRRFAGFPGVCLGKKVVTSCYQSQSGGASSSGSSARRQSSSSSGSSGGCYKWGWECKPLKDVVQNDVQNTTTQSVAVLDGFSSSYTDEFIAIAEAKLAWLCPGLENKQLKDLEAAAALQSTGILIILIAGAFQFIVFVVYHMRIRFFVKRGQDRKELCKCCFAPTERGYSVEVCCESCCGCIRDTWGLRRVVGLLMLAVSGVVILCVVMLCIALPMIKRHFIERCEESRPSAEDLGYSRSEDIQIGFIVFTLLLEMMSVSIGGITLCRGRWDPPIG